MLNLAYTISGICGRSFFLLGKAETNCFCSDSYCIRKHIRLKSQCQPTLGICEALHNPLCSYLANGISWHVFPHDLLFFVHPMTAHGQFFLVCRLVVGKLGLDIPNHHPCDRIFQNSTPPGPKPPMNHCLMFLLFLGTYPLVE